MPIPVMRKVAVVAYTFLVAAFAPAMAADGSLFIDFEQFPGPDGILGTPDGIRAPSCPSGFCGPLSNEFSSIRITFNAGTLFEGSLSPGTAATNHFVSSTPPDATYGWFMELGCDASGTSTLSAPTQPGQYEFRYMVRGAAVARKQPGDGQCLCVSVGPSGART